MGRINPLFEKSAAEISKMTEEEIQEAHDSLSLWERFWLYFWLMPHRAVGSQEGVAANGTLRIFWTAFSHPLYFAKNILFGTSTAFRAMRHFIITPIVLLALVAALVWAVSNGYVSFGLGDL